MIGSHRWLTRSLIVVIAAMTVAPAAASARSAGPYPPACRAGTFPGAVNPPYACVIPSFVSDTYTTPLLRRQLSVTHRVVNRGRYSYVAVSVKVDFSDALPQCPGGGVPLSSIPCQMDPPSVGMIGRYLRGKPRLDVGGLPIGNPASCTAQPSGVCRFDFRLYEDETPGEYVGVMSVSLQELTQNPANDLGQAGFQFAVGVHVPRPPAH